MFKMTSALRSLANIGCRGTEVAVSKNNPWPLWKQLEGKSIMPAMEGGNSEETDYRLQHLIYET